MKYTAFICEDEELQREYLTKSLKKAAMMAFADVEIELEIITAGSYDEAVVKLARHSISGGLYFLDIELGKGSEKNGVDLAEKIKKIDPRSQVTFVTAYNEYMPMTFERRLGPVDYINKNAVNAQERLNGTLRIAIQNLSKAEKVEKDVFTYKVARTTRSVAIEDIYYIQTMPSPHKIEMQTSFGKAEFLGNITAIAQETPTLVKISSHCLINPDKVRGIRRRFQQVEMENGILLRYSRANRIAVKKMIEKK